MTKTAKPVVHARDHEHGGSDTIQVHYEDVGDEGEGGGGTALAYIVAEQESQTIAASSSDYLDFFSIFTPGSSITSGTAITIATAGMYELLAVGTVTYGDTNIQAQVQPEINGSTISSGSITDASLFSVVNEGPATFTMDWAVTVSLLKCISLDPGDIVKLLVVNGGTFGLEARTWQVLVRQLG